jgi:MFS family permease
MLWLLLARASVGVGEAAYGTIAPSLLADYYPRIGAAASWRSSSARFPSAPRSAM